MDRIGQKRTETVRIGPLFPGDQHHHPRETGRQKKTFQAFVIITYYAFWVYRFFISSVLRENIGKIKGGQDCHLYVRVCVSLMIHTLHFLKGQKAKSRTKYIYLCI